MQAEILLIICTLIFTMMEQVEILTKKALILALSLFNVNFIQKGFEARSLLFLREFYRKQALRLALSSWKFDPNGP